ncbi:hypothetical protein BGZ68_007320 [Mortierella alpina]|nr:hypothetical protein BGZ68_007320 [Mortierella alpina]
MAKKDKKGEGAVQNREIFQRMNFLYQAAMYMATITTPKQSQQTSEECYILSSSSSADRNSDPSTEQRTSEVARLEQPQPENADVEMQDGAASTTPIHEDDTKSVKEKAAKLSRTKRRALLRERKVNIAMEQISENNNHHGLTNRNNTRSRNALSGTARFYASTLREIGRKNVIRIDPVIKRSFCLRCEAVLVPYVSSEVRIEEDTFACGARV